jgi:hypothetical protein
VPANSCTDDYVNLAGVIANTPVLFIAMSVLPVGVFVAYAHGDTVGSMKVRLCNVTNVAINPTSSTFSATIF